MPTTPAQVRQKLIDTLQLDLIGPTPDDLAHAEEVLNESPSLWYLTGFLVPYEATPSQRSDDTADDDLDLQDRPSNGDDDTSPEAASARRAYFPSSMGLNFFVTPDTQTITAIVNWGEYTTTKPPAAEKDTTPQIWQRQPRQVSIEIPIPTTQKVHKQLVTPDGLELTIAARPVSNATGLPPGTQSVSLFLVNNRPPCEEKDLGYIFQAQLTVTSAISLVPRPNPRGQSGNDLDEAIADLQYRDEREYTVGHNVSVVAHLNPDRTCNLISTAWMPTAEVEKVIPGDVPAVELEMETIAAAEDARSIQDMLGGIVTAYSSWIITQQAQIPTLDRAGRIVTAKKLLQDAERINRRIAAGLESLNDPQVFAAFKLANRAMATAICQRFSHNSELPADFHPKWRPFQLAFILMNMVGIADSSHSDREIVDLLFFPTGGGKTEAYLGLAAFTLVLRRLQNPGIQGGAGLSVLMRYTLRLLTLDQLGRAATLICALELERQQDPQTLGDYPFEIGLWVGMAATPNRMGKKGDNDANSARARTIAFQNDTKGKPSPIPLENCPWCGERFLKDSFQLLPNNDTPRELRVSCISRKCKFRATNPLPLIAIDDTIYRRLPCFLIATIDKFANLPWIGQTAGLFGKVTHHCPKDGFSGAADTAKPGKKLPQGCLLPPDLIIQDELHLISGPLGTMAGLYETAIDALSTYEKDGRPIRPKIIASTATVRRASRQIRALFGRTEVDIFPPPGIDRRDSFFAKTVPANDRHPRIYLGIAAQGRSLKVALLRSYMALLGAGQKEWELAGGKKNLPNPADPYMTLLGYFNSLRELGGSRRIVEDEVNTRLKSYVSRHRVNELAGSFVNREIDNDPCELTSRVSTNKVADTKRRLDLTFDNKDRVDVALATNMISVGLDITRLGLMVVLGQPKTAAEYIQATSRVGRDENRPGLVITLLNIHRPRDRSQYEHFTAWHTSFYRAVEATSVTPFSPRAIDRGLAAVTVALARLGDGELTAPLNAANISNRRQYLEFAIDTISKRAEGHDSELDDKSADRLRQKLRGKVLDLLDDWEKIADKGLLQYQEEAGKAPPLLRNFLDPDLKKLGADNPAHKFRAQRSLRDVEPVVELWVINPDNVEIDGEES
jgi:Helicase conserved C-terminal domain